MKQLYCFLSLFIYFAQTYGQACLPDSTIRDSAVGVYPKPVSPTNPNGGITTPACINKPFSFNLTVKISDTVSVPGVPFPVNLNSAKIATSGAIMGLPEGISYACNPPDCSFPKNSIGCLILQGTPTSANAPGIYKPVITITLSTLFGNIELEYPGEFFPGEYLLTLLDENCAVSTENYGRETDTWYPTLTRGWVYTKSTEVRELSVCDAMGRVWMSRVNTTGGLFEFTSVMPDGLYLLRWKDQSGLQHSQKLILDRQ